MKNLKSLFLVGIIVVAGSAVAAQSSTSAKLQTIYAKLDALQVKKDIPGLKKLLNQISTPDCVFIGLPKGNKPADKMSRDAALQQMEMVMPNIDKITTSMSHVDNVSVSGGSATAMVSSTIVMKTKPGPGGPSHTFVQKNKTSDVWVNVGGSWKLKSSKILTQSATQDGKPLPGA